MHKAVFIFYGYFLKGTGSAIYARELTRALNKEGIDVFLFSQEEKVDSLDFIERSFIIDLDEGRIEEVHRNSTPYNGKTLHFKHDLKGFLPLYVYDSYPDYKVVKTFSDLKEKELEFYASCLRDSVKIVLDNFSVEPKAVLYHHLFPLPYALSSIFRNYDVKKAAVYHGSDLNFAIRKSQLAKSKFLESLNDIDLIVTLTEAGHKEVKSYLNYLKDTKIDVVHPGIDFNLFHPRASKKEALSEFHKLFSSFEVDAFYRSERERLLDSLLYVNDYDSLKKIFIDIEKIEAIKMPDGDLTKYLEKIEAPPLILFAGKYLWTKGIPCLLFAMPYVWKEFCDANLIIVGYGSSRGFLEKLRIELSSGNLEGAARMVLSHKELDPGSKEEVLYDVPVVFSKKLLEERFRLDYLSLTDFGKFRTQIRFFGYLDHLRLAPLMSAADVFVAPSIFKESFGLVLVEASASGTIPIGSCHSGFKDILTGISDEFESLSEICVELNDNFIENLASSIINSIKVKKTHPRLKQELYSWTKNNYSWESSARKLIKLLLN
ncbi:MAG: glycosyltransferase family 4 protein [Actinobacteria bacterium]|nr:glycosyltransferase family 4 protein [Actinomycetota bacterium]